jgi:adenylate kinase
MNVIMLGAPGAGKGTYAERICARYGFTKISMGDIFRHELEINSELGKKIKQYMDSGKLVPDEITVDILNKRMGKLKAKGIIFDGFPRTVAQAEALEKLMTEHEMEINHVLFINTPKQVIVERIAGRRVCKNCGAIYHVENLPTKVPGVCDKCAKAVYQREDDKPEIVAARFDTYERETKPLIKFYQKRKLLREIDGKKDVNAAMVDVIAILE